ncbi:lytic transglycosylase domain-containing protein [Sphingomonas chungangi]|uniref:lytic transglycosylase domain-containing protein n=1 Tax=Sphingomonas chungangi TaxID=2683589 RepID=UPI001FE6204F|nr:lytic transglycosylase domain-containing protein [Sphingomonas chungangi]
MAFSILPLGGGIAHADVLEIDDQGTVHVRTGGAEVQWIDPAAANAETGDDLPAIPVAAVTEIAAPAQVPDALRAPLETAAAHYDLSPQLLAALVWQESRWHPAAVSARGAVGLAQLMPGTARALAVDAKDPSANLDGGAHYLRQMLDRFDGDVERALAAYNAGPGRVVRAGGLPRIAETRAYVSTIIDRLTPDLSTGLATR